ncbi:GntR family transcriptional regulator [Anseongella ginsenosidimutans]|uniref:GntR family transcriptional regulator n=1 Tax=Anseongella ginsenosidimutans TaxID=496056 RepID=A0A4R3KWZ6_9SPHI|nr:substrate-binding domain-containing protein [Anseongella ginsenosidimutans]QEC51374.1 GntR family transcriptional regulator [Anseongella ginsenosidimutans]TCS89921.1 GntR family transcriptional regulator [Anseongella ginsenosidimutans]
MEVQFDIEFKENTPKYLQIIDSVIHAISKGKLKRGDKIPSINQFSEEYLLSRDTVEKAYRQLIKDGILTAVRGKGYYINRVDVEAAIRVLLLFNKISNYKKQIYNGFTEVLGRKAFVDLHIHHCNSGLFKSLIQNSLGEYHYYVIMPHFYAGLDEAMDGIAMIPADKLIILDKDIPLPQHPVACVYQDFEKDILYALNEAIDLIKKYRKLILVFPAMVPYPKEIIKGFRLFSMQHNIEHEIIQEIEEDTVIAPDEAYVVIEETDLVNLIKNCKERGLRVGEDLGIISYNDTPLKEILLNGITAITTDHELMGETAARLILENRREKIKNPFSLIRRKSL